MADAPASAIQEDADKKKKSILEEKSKEDLIKLVKKYLSLLQKAKNKSDELTGKCTEFAEKCTFLEREKESIILQHQSSERDFLDKIEVLEDHISKLNAKKDQEIAELKQKLETAEERSYQVSSLREKEEQLQCFNLKVQSLKASCQCIQEENEKLRKLNKENSEEIHKLTDERNELRLNLDKKVEEFHEILNNKIHCEKEYKKCLEEVSSLKSKTEELSSEKAKIQNENQTLLIQIKNCEEECENLEKKLKTDDLSLILTDNEKLREENNNLRKENETLKENDNFRFSNTDFEVIQSKVSYETLDPNISISALEKENIALESELSSCRKEIHRLQEEIKKFACFSQFNEYKAGIELALLHGASTEDLIYSDEPHIPKVDLVPTKDTTEYEVSNTGFDYKNVCAYLEEFSGLECALLQGGDMSQLEVAGQSAQNLNDSQMQAPELYQNLLPSPNNDLALNYETELKEKEYNILKKNLNECFSLYHDVLKENDVLKQELEELKSNSGNNSRICVSLGINTDFENTSAKMMKDHENIGETNTALKSSYPEFQENYKLLSCEIFYLYEKFSKLGNLYQNIEPYTTDPIKLLKEIENKFIEVQNNLEKTHSELTTFNLQLEMLVIGIKQGVRQKTSATTVYQAENNLEENICLLKVLLDDLVMRANNFTSKLKNVETSAMLERKKVEEELLQIKELNQFLEDENKELSDEIMKLKCQLKNVENSINDDTYDDIYCKSPNLYSIEESNEFDEKADADANANLITDDKKFQQTTVTSNFSMQTSFNANDFAVQVDLNLQNENNEVNHDINATVSSSQTNEGDILAFEQISKENESLKRIITEKSNLVENIHCQMDSLLTKVEELSVELQNKEDDLKHCQCLNADLKSINADLLNIKQQQFDALKNIQKSVLDSKNQNSHLCSDVKSFVLTFKDLVTDLNNNVMNIIQENNSALEYFKDKCCHKEKNLNIIKEWVSQFTNEFDCWFQILNEIPESSDPTYNYFETIDLSPLAKSLETPSHIISQEVICDQNACCLILENIELLNSYKGKLFSHFFNLLYYNYVPLLKELCNYKTIVIPNLNKNIAELEKKIYGTNCQVSSKDIKPDTEHVSEKTVEESLQNQLTDVEIKMNKFKQIALKLKKELAQTKEQFNEITLEKEKFQKQNEELLEEMNKISDEQCKYVQNYQSLQNEFDKLQDECEMHKINLKKLEEDLAGKLMELTASKEQVLNLESQLKSTKILLESSSSAKKELEIKCADSESKVIVLESKINDKIQKINSLEVDIAKHLKDLSAVQEDNKNLKDQLQHAQKEGKKKSLLDLEMADYERSIAELNSQIQKKNDEIEELNKELQCMKEKNDSLLEEIKSTESLKETEAKRAENLKEILEKTKLELNSVKEHESELLTKNASLQVQFETMAQQQEDYKLRLSEASAQIQHLQDVIKTSSDNHQRIAKSYELKISNQKQEILTAHKEIESVKQEFENYKIRVHSVLKQQKTVTPVLTSTDDELKEKLEAMNEKLKLQVKDLSEKHTALTLEYESLQEEYDGLLQRYNKVIDDREQKDKEWHQRLELINAEKNQLRATQEELSSQHVLQNEMLVATYKKQIKIMSDEHKRIVNDLQKQLDAADVEIARLQRDQQKLQGLPLTPMPQDSTTSLDLLSQERQEGEGSENTDDTNTPIKHLSLTTIPSSGFLPFEKLLQSPIEPGTPASYISNTDSEKLVTDLQAANKKIDHLSDLLNDSESTNLRLSEQVRVLKDEVRRLEYNKEREQHAENLEYLKNVFIKFTSLQPGSEKAMLIPVLTTMLKLNSAEQHQLKSVAGDLDAGESANSGWSSYLHRWSGLS